MIDHYRILIIEDYPNDIDLIRLGFEKHDEFFLDVAITGEEGLEKMSEVAYDLVSVDFALPGISGLDVLEQIRKFDQNVPVVMVTGRDTEDLQVVAFQKHATSYIAKSVESFKSLPLVFEALIKESQFRSAENRMKEELEQSEGLSKYILDNSPAGIYVLQEGRFKLVNPKFAEIFGCNPEDLINEPFCTVVNPGYFEPANCWIQDETIEEVVEDETSPTIHEFKICGNDGKSSWIEAHIIALDEHEGRWVFGNLVDITERKEREKALNRRNQELLALHNITLRSIHFEGDLVDLLDGILSDAMAGLKDVELRGAFLIEGGILVLRHLDDSLEDLIDFMDNVADELLLKEPRLSVISGAKSKRLWASAPFTCRGEALGLLVAGGGDDMESTFNFVKELARHIGDMVEMFQLRKSVSRDRLAI